jgi:uncharacterized protein (DUF58 family)
MQFSKWITLGFGALCLVAVAGVLRAQHLYYMAAILLTLPGVSYVLGWYALRGLEFSRELPQVAWEGETGALGYAVHNHTRLARFFLSIHEPLPNWIVPEDAEPPLFNVAGGDTTRVVHPVHYQRRGVYRVNAFDVTAMDPLGVFAFTRHVPAEDELVVYPMPSTLPTVDLSGAERFGWQEFITVALRGSGVDPDGVRAYTPGDPLRRIHWRQTARTNRLAVIEYEEAQAVNLLIALDIQQGTEVGHGSRTTLEYGIKMAASVAHQSLQQGASVGLILPTDLEEGATHLAEAAVLARQPGRGQDQLYRILDALARVEANSTQTLHTTLTQEMPHLVQGTSLLVITARANPALPPILLNLAARGSRVTVVYVDPESFGSTRVNKEQSTRFIEELLASQVRVFGLKYRQEGELIPEAIGHGSFAANAPI